MQARTPRKASTMARRFLETSLPSSQKGKTSHFSPTRRQTSYSHHSLSSSHLSQSPFSSRISQPTLSFPPIRNADHHHYRPQELAHGKWLTRFHSSGRGAPTPQRNRNRLQTQHRNHHRFNDTKKVESGQHRRKIVGDGAIAHPGAILRQVRLVRESLPDQRHPQPLFQGSGNKHLSTKHAKR